MHLRPTGRGLGMVLLGLGVMVGAIAVGSPDLLVLGAIPVLATVVGVLILAADARPGRRGYRVQRSAQPDPAQVGQLAQVRVQVTGPRAGELQLREQAATELSGGRPLRARVTRGPDQITLGYQVTTQRRGRWTMGPLTVTRTDPFGVARIRGPLGDPQDLSVWPDVVELPAPRTLLLAEPDRPVIGAHSPGSDDAALREYQVGDDLRRVHWASSARRGGLLVRTDEHAGVRTASVLLDPAPAGEALEWSIRMAASAALALHAAGHPTQLLTDGPHPGTGSRTALLDATVDLTGQPDREAADRALLAQIRTVESTDSGVGLVVAVLGAPTSALRTALAGLSTARPCWAIIHGTDDGATARDLLRAGWRVVQVEPGADPTATWLALGSVA
ncbi:DUF58 domain-containing protein [Cellulomonas sp. NPDC089187]|uniref:DUF58 domain-containing protein n=1 Tax=Cellulomonas sp. NPDC089187 TaxID=3154970 RepID=UPI00343C2A66